MNRFGECSRRRRDLRPGSSYRYRYLPRAWAFATIYGAAMIGKCERAQDGALSLQDWKRTRSINLTCQWRESDEDTRSHDHPVASVECIHRCLRQKVSDTEKQRLLAHLPVGVVESLNESSSQGLL